MAAWAPFFSLLSLFLCLLGGAGPSLAAVQNNAPVYAGSYAGSCDLLLQQPSGFSPSLFAEAVTIATNGNDFFPMSILIGTRGGPSVNYSLTGAFGCANGQLSVSLFGEKPCTSDVSPQNVDLCVNYLPRYCSGTTFSYSTYLSHSGVYELEIVNLCGMIGSVVLQCQGTCFGVVQCSPTILQNNIIGGYVNGTDSVIIATNSTIAANGSTTLESSNNVIINSPNVTDIPVNGDGNNVYFNTTQVSVNQYCAKDCESWIDYKGTTALTGQTVTNAAYEPLEITSTAVELPDGLTLPYWVVAGPAITYVGLTEITVSVDVCLQNAEVTGIDPHQPLALLVTLWNVTGNAAVDSGAFAQSTVVSNASSNAYLLTSACTGMIIQNLRPLTILSLYVKLADPGLIPGPDSLTLKGGATFGFKATPPGCAGCTLNVNITNQYANGTQFKAKDCNYVDPGNGNGTFYFGTTAVCNLTTDQCLSGSIASNRLTLEFGGVCGIDTDAAVVKTGIVSLLSGNGVGIRVAGNNLTFDAERYQFSAEGNCLTQTTTAGANNVTTVTYNSQAVCSVFATGCINADIVDGELQLMDTNSVCSFQAGSGSPASGSIVIQNTNTTTWTEVSTGVFTLAVSALSGNGSVNGSCAQCVNDTLEVEKLCVQQTQCQVRSDPPTTSPQPVWAPCPWCSGNSGGGGGGGGGGGSGGGIIPPPIVPIGFFPPIIPIIIVPIITGDGSGGGGGGTTTGGTYIPVVNFTKAVPSCDNSTIGSIVLNTGETPSRLYDCAIAANGSYIWNPICNCQSTMSNATNYYLNTTSFYQNGSTLYMDSSSQAIFNGNVFINSLTTCPSGAGIQSNAFSGCSGTPAPMPHGIVADTFYYFNTSLVGNQIGMKIHNAALGVQPDYPVLTPAFNSVRYGADGPDADIDVLIGSKGAGQVKLTPAFATTAFTCSITNCTSDVAFYADTSVTVIGTGGVTACASGALVSASGFSGCSGTAATLPNGLRVTNGGASITATGSQATTLTAGTSPFLTTLVVTPTKVQINSQGGSGFIFTSAELHAAALSICATGSAGFDCTQTSTPGVVQGDAVYGGQVYDNGQRVLSGLTAGTGISISGSAPTLTISNSATPTKVASSTAGAGPSGTVPTGATIAMITVIGGGGGGGGSDSCCMGGGGGGSGFILQVQVTVTAGQTYSFTVGAGGPPGGVNVAGTDGGYSYVTLNGNQVAFAAGGKGGGYGGQRSGFGGDGGDGYYGGGAGGGGNSLEAGGNGGQGGFGAAKSDYNGKNGEPFGTVGGNGGFGAPSLAGGGIAGLGDIPDQIGGGGGGGGQGGGQGGNAGTTVVPAQPGFLPGAGGGGGAASPTTGRDGNVGADGSVVIVFM